MFDHKTEAEAREQILAMVEEYCSTFHNKKGPFKEGDRIPYASRVYDHHEMVNLVDSALEFWLTSGRFTDEFEKKLADYLGIRFCSIAVFRARCRVVWMPWTVLAERPGDCPSLGHTRPVSCKVR